MTSESESPERADTALKKSKTQKNQSAHKTPKKSSPSHRRTPQNRNTHSPTPGADNSTANNLVSDDDKPGLEARIQRPNHNHTVNFYHCIDQDHPMGDTTTSDTLQPKSPPSQPAQAPSLEEELARGTPARQDENPHLTNLDAVDTSDPTDVLFYNNLEKVFVKNSGQFPRVVVDLPFLLEGQDSNVVTTVMDNPSGWLPVIHALGGRYLYSKVPDIVDNFASALSEAVGCPEMMVLCSQIPPPPKPSCGHGQRGGNCRGRGGRGGTAESSHAPPHTPPATSRELFAPPYAAFLEALSHEICDRFFRQQTFLKDKVTTAHIILQSTSTVTGQ
ncbi:hypothetical protein BDP27DRAFT_1360603 [Rhodocollybia butyracea]|uniref:Uncharacterized protein n=1 Tax=Rhodocollybia butyracea TaxID=206335 RepID=A0A9P5Q144_9AGAR|nr:hypothetical protein BDP27DRAFT_1360603 [Rhodocollybia butyracea]